MIKRKYLLSILAMTSCAIMLTGCSDSDFDDPSYSANTTYEEAKNDHRADHIYKLAFFENRASSDLDTQYYELGYYDHGQIKHIRINSDDDTYHEIISPSITKAFVEDRDGNEFVIHRPPYNMYEFDKKKKMEKEHDYQLAFFDNRATSDTETQYYTIGIYRHNGKLKTFNINSDDNNYREIIDPKLTTPYVHVDDDDNFTIYRPPYNQFNQPLINGKVTDKQK